MRRLFHELKGLFRALWTLISLFYFVDRIRAPTASRRLLGHLLDPARQRDPGGVGALGRLAYEPTTRPARAPERSHVVNAHEVLRTHACTVGGGAARRVEVRRIMPP
jgi:hypothetical protein